MDEVEKLKAVNSNLEQRKEELVKELEQVDKPRTLDHTKDRKVIFCGIRVWAFRLDYQPKRFKIKLERLERFRLKFTANVNWYHMTKFCPELSLTVYYFYTKISSFTLALSKGIVLDSFYRLIFYSEKFSISIWRLSFVVNVTLISVINQAWPGDWRWLDATPCRYDCWIYEVKTQFYRVSLHLKLIYS